MAEYQSIPGYRINQESPKPERTLSIEYLKQSPEASRLNIELWRAAMTLDDDGNPQGKCYGKQAEYSSDDLPTDRQAQIMCGDCKVFELCRKYAEVERPAWGVYAGRVYGRKLQESMRDD